MTDAPCQTDVVPRSSPSAERRLIRFQAFSGLVFAGFLILHLVNTMAGAFGQAAYDDFMGAARAYYQFPPIEIMVVGVSGLVHMAVGVTRMLRRRKRYQARVSSEKTSPPGWLRLHRITGWFLMFVIVGHFAATRGPGLFVGMPAEFSYLTFSLTEWPLVMFPYYFLLYGCGVFHLLHGSVVALNVAGFRSGPPTRAWTRFAWIVAMLVGGIGILSMAGLIGDVDNERFERYREFYETYVPFMVTWK